MFVVERRIVHGKDHAYETLCDLIRMILTMKYFTFNDKHCLQTHGTAMGTRKAPSYANIQ